MILEGDRVDTPRGRGWVAMVLQDWGFGVCDAGWHQDPATAPPTLYRVRLDSGCEGTFGAGDVTRLPQLARCDP